MRNKCAQRLVQRLISPGPRPLSMRPEVGKAFIENTRMPTICTSGQEFCIWEELYIYNKDISAA